MRWRLQLYCLILSVIVLMFTSMVIEVMATTATQCGCQRGVARGVTANLSETTCSVDAWRRGGGQKVIGFSLYELGDGGYERTIELEKEGLYHLPTYYDVTKELKRTLCWQRFIIRAGPSGFITTSVNMIPSCLICAG